MSTTGGDLWTAVEKLSKGPPHRYGNTSPFVWGGGGGGAASAISQCGSHHPLIGRAAIASDYRVGDPG